MADYLARGRAGIGFEAREEPARIPPINVVVRAAPMERSSACFRGEPFANYGPKLRRSEPVVLVRPTAELNGQVEAAENLSSDQPSDVYLGPKHVFD